ncbi:beta-lactamase family protein [Gammaproteobacteria bacterium]|nr:beta-lactamase family protein [Gammaproteobacteria bacterium]MDC0919581.1 serine hydrolase [Gammaproteobacteria bacterium]
MLNKILIGIVFALIVAAVIYIPKAIRVYNVVHLFDEDKIVNNFMHMNKVFPSTPIKSSGALHIFETGTFELPEFYEMNGEQHHFLDALDYFKSDGLIVLHEGALIYENYWQGNSKDQPHISWSVAKSFLSALIGIAYHDGLIEDLNDPITKYLKDFNGTGYANVPIKDILQMSSGIIFNEDYGDYNSDINKFARALAQGTSMRDFAKALKNGKQPGTFNHYVSIDTQMLAMLLEEVTGQPVAKNLEDKIWTKIGMEHDAYYMVDDTGVAWALGGLNATLRDYAKFGQLYLNNGQWNNEQIVPEDWVHASHKPDGPHLQPGENDLSSNTWGYGYQWWIPGFPSTDYLAAGIYNQYIYIDPITNVVIAKTSSNYKFNQEREYSKEAHVAMFRAIAQSVAESL